MSVTVPQRPRRSNILAIALVGLFLVAALGSMGAYAGKPVKDEGSGGPNPADKGSAMATSFELMMTQLEEGATSAEHTLFSTSVKNSGGTDLLLTVNLECAIWTDVTLMGNDEAESAATVNVWIEIDGQPVTIGSDDTEDPGVVTFCNRTFRSAVAGLENESVQHEQFLRTRGAHSFEWIQLDLPSGTHTVEVKTTLEAQVTGTGVAKAGIGKRTFVIEPTKFANDLVL